MSCAGCERVRTWHIQIFVTKRVLGLSTVSIHHHETCGTLKGSDALLCCCPLLLRCTAASAKGTGHSSQNAPFCSFERSSPIHLFALWNSFSRSPTSGSAHGPTRTVVRVVPMGPWIPKFQHDRARKPLGNNTNTIASRKEENPDTYDESSFSEALYLLWYLYTAATGSSCTTSRDTFLSSSLKDPPHTL